MVGQSLYHKRVYTQWEAYNINDLTKYIPSIIYPSKANLSECVGNFCSTLPVRMETRRSLAIRTMFHRILVNLLLLERGEREMAFLGACLLTRFVHRVVYSQYFMVGSDDRV